MKKILEGLLETPAAKEVVSTLVTAATATREAAVTVVATAQGAATAAGEQVMYAASTGHSVYREVTKQTGDPHAPRAHQVVTARKLRKEGKTDLPEYTDLPEDVRVQVEAEPVATGRRKTLQQEWETAQADGDGNAPKQPLIVKLSIGGSGDASWRTHCDINGVMTDKDLQATKKEAGKAKTVYYTGHREHDWNFAGPGGPGANNFIPGGMSDTGSNSIANLVENASTVVANAILDALQNEERPMTILIKGHSRGAVAAGRIANALKETFPAAKVEVAQIDPVPGPGQPEPNQTIDVGTIDESTVVYGVYSGHGVSFTPQQVFSAKRIIISQQAHGVAVQSGFTFGGRMYKGSSLNSLPPGVYRDQNDDISVAGELEAVGSPQDVRETFMKVYMAKFPAGPKDDPGQVGQNWDAERRDRIEASLEKYASELDQKAWAGAVEQTMVSLYQGSDPNEVD
ncbi:hypothetical protein [Labedaea rhizosphaerae]|uniref:Uncharacterized protein n=1 Tax=Labedaea rhizosphaerae TaxID=598644 RepID=A0A4R6S8F9_LABRH|nr:hypothetical protein [Labedaea rhizosphaerae]TDP95146.1 hypothetical protein EV186_105378 [Labedaea rhizosphaerae]